MMSLQNTLKKLYEPFLTLDCAVTHYRRSARPPYLVWTETGEEESFEANNHKAEQQISGIVDYYTKNEFDPIIDDVQEILNGEDVGWRLDSVQYEEETNLIHYQWRWWVA
jgi:hypothetical protein